MSEAAMRDSRGTDHKIRTGLSKSSPALVLCTREVPVVTTSYRPLPLANQSSRHGKRDLPCPEWMLQIRGKRPAEKHGLVWIASPHLPLKRGSRSSQPHVTADATSCMEKMQFSISSSDIIFSNRVCLVLRAFSCLVDVQIARTYRPGFSGVWLVLLGKE